MRLKLSGRFPSASAERSSDANFINVPTNIPSRLRTVGATVEPQMSLHLYFRTNWSCDTKQVLYVTHGDRTDRW